MKTSVIVLITILLVVVIAAPIVIAGCTQKLNIKKYPAAKTKFDNTVIDNLHLSAQDDALLENQDRGFRGEIYWTVGTEKAYPSDNQSYFDRIDEQCKLYEDDKVKIMQCYIYLNEYRDKDLDSMAMQDIKEYFELLKERKIRVLLRFAYEYTESENYDAKDKQILKHLNTIGSFIKDNEGLFNDVVYAMQFGLIGLWGEGHGHHYHHNIRKLLTKLCKIIPEDIYIMVRTPEILSQVPSRYEHRFAVHDDFLVGVNHRWGMMDWNDPQYQDLLNKNQYAIADGEMPWGNYSESEDKTPYQINGLNFVKQVVGYGLTSLSLTHNYKETPNTTYHLEKWKSEYLTKQQLDDNHIPYLDSMLINSQISIYKYLQFHLGYLLGVSNLKDNGNSVSFMISNFGMAAPFEYELQVFADNKEIEVEQKLLTRFSQQIITIDKSNFKDGKINQVKIRFVHRRTGATIKLANNLPYLVGYNIIDL